MARKRNDIVLSPLEDGNQKYAIRSNADIVCMTGGTGGGKAQPLDSQILTVDGWKKMGEISIGDEVFSPLNTEPSVVTGIYPQGVKPIYEVATDDGRITRCCGEHLWTVRTNIMVQKHRKNGSPSFYVKSTKELLEQYINKGKSIFIPVARPYEGKEKKLPIDPYVLGVWLGDGVKGCNTLTISNDEPDVVEKIAKILNTTFHLHGSTSFHNSFHKNEQTDLVRKAIKDYGLETYSRQRFIPKEYLHASIEQRTELLKGLMDSDGNVEKKNRYRFSTTSDKLKDTFIELCRGLGYVTGLSYDSRNKFGHGGCYNITVQTKDVIFSSKKHLERYNQNLEIEKSKERRCVYANDHIKIISIKYIGDMEAQCIMVSNRDHVYCTDDYIVTHNTVALYYAPIEYLAMNDNAKIVCFMRNVSDFWASGKVADSLKKMYPLIDRSIKKQPHDPIGEIIRRQEDMGLKLYNGSEIKFQQLDNESPAVIDKIAKGLQAKKLIFDECNKFEWRTITSFFPRLRSDSAGKAQIFLAQNPERECFLRKLCGKGVHGGGWINDDGTIDKSMDGVVMYFNMQDGDLDKTYWGRTKKEVYEKCKDHIDSLLAQDPDMTYEDFILSMVFFTFSVRDNKKMLAKNKGYRGLAANSATAASAYAENWNYSITDEESETDDLLNVELTSTDVERMFRPSQIPNNSELLKRRMTMDMATTGFDNLIFKYWELWSHYGWICRDFKYCINNKNREAVIMAIDFRDKHNLQEKEMIIDVQGFGYLEECFPKATSISGAKAPTNRSKAQFRSFKDEMAHVAMEMIQSGLIHYEPALASAHYNHKNMKREGGTTLLKHMVFESRIFQFDKTPNGRIEMMPKEKMKSILKGMSPDLFDNTILLCGGTIYDCYRMLRDDAGIMRKKLQAEDMLTLLNVNSDDFVDTRIQRPRIRNASEILNILSTI